MSCLTSRDLEDLLRDIEEIKYHAENARLDGWTQNYYREKLIAVKEFIENIDKETFKIHGES